MSTVATVITSTETDKDGRVSVHMVSTAGELLGTRKFHGGDTLERTIQAMWYHVNAFHGSEVGHAVTERLDDLHN